MILLYIRRGEDRTGPLLSAVITACDDSSAQAQKQQECFASIDTDQAVELHIHGVVYHDISKERKKTTDFWFCLPIRKEAGRFSIRPKERIDT